MKYNSVGFLGFSVDHKNKCVDKSVQANDIRKAILNMLNKLSDEDLVQVVELHDTQRCSNG